MKISKGVIDLINNSNKVAIYTHVRPDADCLGSACALKMALEQMGKEADIFCDSEIPGNYVFIKYINKINHPQLMEYDTAIAVDCSDSGRLGKYITFFNNIEHTINIDHHKTTESFADVNFVRTVGSTGEILYYLLKQLKITFDKDIATALYSAVASDTGCFLHSNTTSDTHKIASSLLKHNIDLAKANYYLFKRRSLGQIKLQQIGLNHLRLFAENKVAIMYLEAKNFKECNIGTNESFGLVDMCINIEKVEIGILISEIKPNLFAVSIRGKGNVDVSKLAEVFGGGGHENAAGCNIFGTCHTVINKLVRASKKILC